MAPVYIETTVVFTTKIDLLNTTLTEQKSKLFGSHSNMEQGGRQNLISDQVGLLTTLHLKHESKKI